MGENCESLVLQDKCNIEIVLSLAYVVDTQKNRLIKNRLNEDVLLSTQNIC